MPQPQSQAPIIRAVYIVGPSSSGKSTLCDALAKHCDITTPAYIREVARTVMKKQGFSRDDVGKMEMQYEILKAQAEADAEARKSVARGDATVILSDRSIVDPIAYALLSSQTDGNERAQALINTAQLQLSLPHLRRSTVVLLDSVPEWVVDDGVRSVDESYASVDAFRSILKQLEIPFHEVDGTCTDLQDRVQKVLKMIGATS
ncbi:hypothetical protein EW145_g3224 [Phellinidium pouzarii]|uniref:NadR/Ttd14 AAA domain-containing protein n=1 Tax=Phellinidium pouzarii TaxID=167371 RepID=A0A4S4L8D5_9AGAM|nr:hypothetical protein EW145_g3224 [Phellinidium pouzarii]